MHEQNMSMQVREVDWRQLLREGGGRGKLESNERIMTGEDDEKWKRLCLEIGM
jgi:hypothetical protein